MTAFSDATIRLRAVGSALDRSASDLLVLWRNRREQCVVKMVCELNQHVGNFAGGRIQLRAFDYWIALEAVHGKTKSYS